MILLTKLKKEDKMKHLIIVRHGESSSVNTDSKLDSCGKKQIEKLSEKLSQLINKENVIVIPTTSATRVLESAEILASKWNLEINLEECKNFFPKHELHMYPERTMELITLNESKYESIILVGHDDLLNYFLPYFNNRKEISISNMKEFKFNFGRGDAIMVDLEKTQALHIKQEEP